MTATNINIDIDALLQTADAGIRAYLTTERDDGRIAPDYFDRALSAVMPNLTAWLTDPHIDRLSPHCKLGIKHAIDAGRWERLVNAYVREVNFGTGGIREKMGIDRDEVLMLKEHGIDAPILKGPNTMNNIVLMKVTAGVARFAKDRKLDQVVIGFDSRVRGADFARMIAEVLLAFDCTVHVFDEACMYPSVTYAVPRLRADIGIFISASHNDFRYNGFKLSCGNGSQFSAVERNDLFNNFIATTTTEHVKRTPLTKAPEQKLWWLGGEHAGENISHGPKAGLPRAMPLRGVDYAGRIDCIIDIHSEHVRHCLGFVCRPDMIRNAKNKLSVGYSAFNGSGRKAVVRLLNDVGIANVKRINVLDNLDGMFPAFCADPGREQQPDPGDARAGEIAVTEFKKQYSASDWNEMDILIGTDPDSDRCGIIGKLPAAEQRAMGRDWHLLPADDVWTLLLHYRLQWEVEKFGAVRDADKKFIVLSHTTTDALTRTARKFGVGVVKTWVGFAQLATGARAVWDGDTLPAVTEGRVNPSQAKCSSFLYEHFDITPKRSINVGAYEQSNGFSLLGGPPKDAFSLGEGGHVRDKDGAFAALLVAEVAQYAKEQGKSLIDLLNEHVYCDPAIGIFVNYYEPDPLDGEYPGLKGDSDKRRFLMKCIELHETWRDKGHTLGGLPIIGSNIYQTGKYDRVNWDGFPDEGIRLFFDKDRLDHMTIRPSGTSNALRFHVQLHDDETVRKAVGSTIPADGPSPAAREAIAMRKAELRKTAKAIVDDVRSFTGAVL
jgi:phosphoglucomutase